MWLLWFSLSFLLMRSPQCTAESPHCSQEDSWFSWTLAKLSWHVRRNNSFTNLSHVLMCLWPLSIHGRRAVTTWGQTNMGY